MEIEDRFKQNNIPVAKLTTREILLLQNEKLSNIQWLLILSLGATLGFKFVNTTFLELVNVGLSFGLSLTLWVSIVQRWVRGRSVNPFWYALVLILTINGLINFAYKDFFLEHLGEEFGGIITGLSLLSSLAWGLFGKFSLEARGVIPWVEDIKKANGNGKTKIE